MISLLPRNVAGYGRSLRLERRRRGRAARRSSSPAVSADANGRAILRFRERFPRRDRPFVTVVSRLRSPFAENAGRAADHDGAIIERGILHERAREKSFREGRGINERDASRCRPGVGLERAIVFVMLEIAAADEREDAAGLIIERDDRALQIFRRRRGRFSLGDLFLRVSEARRRIARRSDAVTRCLFGRVEMRAQRFLGHLLQLGIDRGVNPEAIAHRAVPTDRGDHLLADVIDRVILSAARFAGCR